MSRSREHINRSNYEEFFLLYVDGELSVIERIALEAFVARNPDLQEELKMLQEAVLLPEEPICFDKTMLFKSVEGEITNANYEEQFLLYVDNELSATEKTTVEKFVLQHPQKQEEFTLLKQVVLEPETIRFPDKKVLYKKERKVIYMQWSRVAVAAVFIGLCFLLTGVLTTSKPADTSVADTKNSNEAGQSLPTKIKDRVVAKAPISLGEEAVATTIKAKNNKPTIGDMVTGSIEEKTKKRQLKMNDNYAISASYREYKKAPVEKVPYNQLPIKDSNALVTTKSPSKTTVHLPASTSNGNNSFVKNDDANNPVQPHKDVAQSTIYKELDTDDDNKSLTIGNLEINKDKLRGFLRKASKALTRKHSTGDEKMAISSFSGNK